MPGRHCATKVFMEHLRGTGKIEASERITARTASMDECVAAPIIGRSCLLVRQDFVCGRNGDKTLLCFLTVFWILVRVPAQRRCAVSLANVRS